MPTLDLESARQRLASLLAHRSARRGRFTLASGNVSTLYIDARMTTMSPEGLSLIGPLAITEMNSQGWQPDSVGGLTLGADPISYAISYASTNTPACIRAFSVRKSPKDHGTAKLIEGPFRAGDNVVIIEDVITTGASALKAAETIRHEGGQILGILALVDREEGGREAILQHGLHVRCIITSSAVLAHLDQIGTSQA